jgi:hypothetical protein
MACFTILYETSTLVYQLQMYIVFSHTQHVALQSYFTWRLVSAPNVGYQQAITQEHENTLKLMYRKVHDLSLLH